MYTPTLARAPNEKVDVWSCLVFKLNSQQDLLIKWRMFYEYSFFFLSETLITYTESLISLHSVGNLLYISSFNLITILDIKISQRCKTWARAIVQWGKGGGHVPCSNPYGPLYTARINPWAPLGMAPKPKKWNNPNHTKNAKFVSMAIRIWTKNSWVLP